MALDDFHDRIHFSGNIDDLVEQVVGAFELGKLISFNVIEMGFEDFNIKIATENNTYVTKVFSKDRKDEQIIRFVETIKQAIDAGVNHPVLYKDKDGKELYEDSVSNVKLIVMAFIQGKTFYDLSRSPTGDELAKICSEAVKINSMLYEPEYIFDSWAIPNMHWMFEKTKDHLSDEGRILVQKAFEYYEKIPLDKLPICFVHGDLIKTNIILGEDGEIYIIDFAVSNNYPRVQELAVMAANLMFHEKSSQGLSLKQRVDMVIESYLAAGGQLTQLEKDSVFNYALPGAAMEYMGSVNERVVGDTSKEIQYWEKLGLENLREALG
jgi:Ser/Thr protein kinase RdoA (MazF antagonist)